MGERLVLSICGPSGAGKSQLAKAVVALPGPERSARVPADYFIAPATTPLSDYLRRPIRYDWQELERTLIAPLGALVATPAFDFVAFQRSEAARALQFPVRPIMVIDAMYPYPKADLRVLLDAPTATRQARIAERDQVWGTRVADRWDQLEASRQALERMDATYDLRLAGDAPLADNARRIVRLLEARSGAPFAPARGPRRNGADLARG